MILLKDGDSSLSSTKKASAIIIGPLWTCTSCGRSSLAPENAKPPTRLDPFVYNTPIRHVFRLNHFVTKRIWNNYWGLNRCQESLWVKKWHSPCKWLRTWRHWIIECEIKWSVVSLSNEARLYSGSATHTQLIFTWFSRIFDYSIKIWNDFRTTPPISID